MMNAAKAIPMTVPESRPSTTTVCPEVFWESPSLDVSLTGCWFTMWTLGTLTEDRETPINSSGRQLFCYLHIVLNN